jgi:hypothetical protein
MFQVFSFFLPPFVVKLCFSSFLWIVKMLHENYIYIYTNYSYITCAHLELAFLSNVYFSHFLPCQIVALILLIWIVGNDGNQYVLTKYFNGICIHACMYASMSQNTLPTTLRMHIF